jgi:HCOMODA/2-hydroxy-3-carboxy-muconic semialdehyde decarboxylase
MTDIRVTKAAAGVDQQLIDLVAANQILVDRGVLDAYGHVSARELNNPDRFLLARNMAPALVTTADIQTFTLEAETDDPRRTYLEKFIHSEIYKARPDVMSIVHSHSMSVVPFSVADRPLRAVSHMAGFLGEGTPVFEIRDDAGDGSDLLIGKKALGASLARSLGVRWVVLMRGHGSVAVGNTLPMAVHRAVFTEMNARVQAQAVQLGECTYLTAKEANAAMLSNDGQITRAWDLWRMQAQARATLQHE